MTGMIGSKPRMIIVDEMSSRLETIAIEGLVVKAFAPPLELDDWPDPIDTSVMEKKKNWRERRFWERR